MKPIKDGHSLPSADALRLRLQNARRMVRRLAILAKAAEKIEQVENDNSHSQRGASCVRGVAQ